MVLISFFRLSLGMRREKSQHGRKHQAIAIFEVLGTVSDVNIRRPLGHEDLATSMP